MANMISALRSPPEIATALAARLKSRRLTMNLSQQVLSLRSGVPLGTLKRFERSGAISLVSFIRLLVALREEAGLDRLLAEPEFESLDDVLKPPRARSRGRIT
ncbi:MAG: XRE family transcriptional regulator [Gammaproteobacteria bacterium]|nr:XRE family transcriptional regulator [Gammaproteobacteria bacterium]